MGNHISVYSDTNVFEKELNLLNSIVNSILTEENMFHNRDYNFLSQDVCEKHYMIMENELQRHLKVHVKELGTSLVLIPKNEEKQVDARINKRQVCEMISNHYMKVLYILCLVKYVYNIEKHGDFSISGIVFRNLKIVDGGLLEINFCSLPHKDYKRSGDDVYKIDFGQLEGLRFLSDYFLDSEESRAFVKILKNVLARNPKNRVKDALCDYIVNHGIHGNDKTELEKLFQQRYREKLVCAPAKQQPKSLEKRKQPSLFLRIERDNPVFSRDYCFAIHKLVIPLNTKDGQRVLQQYNTMLKNYKTNVTTIEKLIQLLVNKTKSGSFELKDLTKPELDDIIYKVKKTIQLYYVQSILDYQNLLDLCKTIPNINVSKQ